MHTLIEKLTPENADALQQSFEDDGRYVISRFNHKDGAVSLSITGPDARKALLGTCKRLGIDLKQ